MTKVTSWSSTVSGAFDPDRYAVKNDASATTDTPDETEAPRPIAVEPGSSSELFALFAEAASKADTALSDQEKADRNAWLANVQLPTTKIDFDDGV